MSTYQFTLIIDGPDLQTEETLDELYEAGCGDALPGRVDDTQYVDFDREAASPTEAIVSAINAIEGLETGDFVVTRIADAGLLSISDIADRIGTSREMARLLIAGERGPGHFPEPVTKPTARYRLWAVSDVHDWLLDYRRAHVEPDDFADDRAIAAINASLVLRRNAAALSRRDRSALIAFADTIMADR